MVGHGWLFGKTLADSKHSLRALGQHHVEGRIPGTNHEIPMKAH
jgi:hypothetical protein